MKQKQTIYRHVMVALLTMISISSLKAQLYYQDSHLFVGQRPTNWSTVGSTPQILIGPEFGIEFYDNGLNFWRPFGSTNWGNYKIFIDQSGKVGIGRKPTTYALEVDGQVWTTSGLLITSDGELKRNISNISESKSTYLTKLKRLNGKSYEKRISSVDKNAEMVAEMVAQGKIKEEDAQTALASLNKTKRDVYKKEIGFIAQEVKEVFPELVEQSADGIYAVNYTGLIPILLEAIKELQFKVEILEDQKKSTDQISTIRNSAYTTNEDVASETKYLSQNIPNPVNRITTIKYNLPKGTNQASIVFYSTSGTIVKNIPLNINEESGTITLSSSEFSSGLYIYKLMVNGVTLASKKMINQ